MEIKDIKYLVRDLGRFECIDLNALKRNLNEIYKSDRRKVIVYSNLPPEEIPRFPNTVILHIVDERQFPLEIN